MSHVVLDGGGVVLQQGVGVSERVASLSLDGSVSEFLRKLKGSFVLLGSSLELAQEDVSVAQIAVGSSLGSLKVVRTWRFSVINLSVTLLVKGSSSSGKVVVLLLAIFLSHGFNRLLSFY